MNATRPPLIIATGNIGKFREFCELLGDLPIHFRSLADFSDAAPEVAEDEPTYLGNAIKKARAIAHWAHQPALADDSGLEVDALGGAPGVHSARYAGPNQDSAANIAKLLGALGTLPAEQRTARFRCVIAVARPDADLLTVEGTCTGRITEAPRGRGGFGYDPIFFCPALGGTFAEVPAAVKHRTSHRAQACAALRPQLLPFLSAP